MNPMLRRGAAALLCLACAGQPTSGLPDNVPTGDSWDGSNDPLQVDPSFVLYVDLLPNEGAGPLPIPGHYWPTWRDSLNWRWQGDYAVSPAAKYAAAFGQPGLPDAISRELGVKGSGGEDCTQDDDCKEPGTKCGTSYDGTVRKCVETWTGICHGWAPYAISERFPINPVVRYSLDGTPIEFSPGDVTGLMSLLWTNTHDTVFVGKRCNVKRPPTGTDGSVEDASCRDINAGAWHVLVANMLGLRQRGFVLDQTYDAEVWNQPSRDYRIDNTDAGKLHEVTREEAIRIVDPSLAFQQVLAPTVLRGRAESSFYTVQTDGSYAIRASGTDVGGGSLSIRLNVPFDGIGADLCQTSVEGGDCELQAKAGDVIYWRLVGDDSNPSTPNPVSVWVGSPRTTDSGMFSASAERFYQVVMQFRFVKEPLTPAASPSEVDNLTSTRTYEYILETDSFGKILGGDWVGGSKTDHPDFVWWPTARPDATAVGCLLSYDIVRALSDESAGVVPPLDRRVVMEDQEIPLGDDGSGSEVSFVTFDSDVREVTFRMTGSGDADLMVKKGSTPTTEDYDCASATEGTSEESCRITLTADEALYGGSTYVVARTQTPDTRVTIYAEPRR